MKLNSVIGLFLLIIVGCSPLETARIMGVGTKPFKEHGKVYTRIIDCDFFSCYDKIYQKFQEIGAHYYRGSRQKSFLVFTNLNSAFKQCSESTEVAVFFEDLAPLKTEVKISSLNFSLAEFIAEKVFQETKID